MIMDDNGGQMIFGDLTFPDICLTSEEKPRKNLTQETCPDLGSNPALLHDRQACYRLSHRGGQCRTKFNFNPYDAKGYTQPFINCRSWLLISFIFEVVKLSPRHIWKPLQYIPQQGQSLHIWNTSLSTTGCYKNKYTIQFFLLACISRFAAAIWSCETQHLAL